MNSFLIEYADYIALGAFYIALMICVSQVRLSMKLREDNNN